VVVTEKYLGSNHWT